MAPGPDISHETRARTLIEALPYLQNFRGKTFLIKYGGAAMEEPELVESVLRDIVFLEAAGVNPVIVHGGGKAITRAMDAAGIQSTFIDGLRVSDTESMELIERTLGDEINPGIVEGIVRLGGKAVGFSGRHVLRCVKRQHTDRQTGQPVDLGWVGDVHGVETASLVAEIQAEFVPVISPLAQDDEGRCHNVNADTAAAEIAKALGVERLIYLSNVNGLRRDPEDERSLISTLRVDEVEGLKAEGVIAGGMIPKVDSAVDALASGVEKVHFLDGRIPHALLLELFTDAGIGTQITPAA
ncbi:MAG: acetylglutamate kinase [Verrucomicrobiota bacterium]